MKEDKGPGAERNVQINNVGGGKGRRRLYLWLWPNTMERRDKTLGLKKTEWEIREAGENLVNSQGQKRKYKNKI